MPLLPVSVAPRIAPPARATASAPMTLLVGLALCALVAVLSGFGVVAASLVGWSSVSPFWGLGLCSVGLVLARVARDRTPRVRS